MIFGCSRVPGRTPGCGQRAYKASALAGAPVFAGPEIAERFGILRSITPIDRPAPNKTYGLASLINALMLLILASFAASITFTICPKGALLSALIANLSSG